MGFPRVWLALSSPPSWVIGIAIETEYEKARRFLFPPFFFFPSLFYYKTACVQQYGIQGLAGVELHQKT